MKQTKYIFFNHKKYNKTVIEEIHILTNVFRKLLFIRLI